MSAELKTTMWMAALVSASVAFSLGFACVTPFAAFAATAALTLSARNALITVVGVWLGNQLTGFFLMNYPWDASTFGWGIAIGAAVVLGFAAAWIALSRLRDAHFVVATLVGVLTAFAIYELTLFAVSISVKQGSDTFAPQIVSPLLGINLGAMILLLVLHKVAAMTRFIASDRGCQAALSAR